MKAIILAAACAALLLAGKTHAGEKLYVALMTDSGIAVADLETLDAWGIIRTGESPAFIKSTPDKKYILATMHGEEKVQVINAVTDEVVKEIITGSRPYALDVSPDGMYAVVCNTGDETASIIDLTVFKEKARIKVPSNVFEVVISKENTAFLVSPEGEMYIMEIKGSPVIKKTIKIPKETYSAAFFPNGTKLFLNSLEEKQIFVMDIQSFQIEKLAGALAGIDGLAVSPDGGELWFGGPDNNINAYSLKKGEVLAVMPRGGTTTNLSIIFSEDGEKVFAAPAGEDARKVYVFNARKKIKLGEIDLSGLPRGLYLHVSPR